MVGTHVRVEFAERLPVQARDREQYGSGFKGVQTMGGAYYPAERVIRLAMRDPMYFDQENIAGHEAFHAVQDLLATSNELMILNREDKRLRAVVGHLMNIGQDELEQISSTEIQAHAFDAWRDGLLQKLGARHLFSRKSALRIAEFLRRAKNAVLGLGFQTSEDIFRAAQTGKMAPRRAQIVGRFIQEHVRREAEALEIAAFEWASVPNRSATQLFCSVD